MGARLRFLWNGLEDLPRSLKLEWRLVAARWVGIASLAPEESDALGEAA
jgi:hypothetical protein